MPLPSLLVWKVQSRVHLGIVVNSVWVSSEIFKTLPCKELLLEVYLIQIIQDNLLFAAVVCLD